MSTVMSLAAALFIVVSAAHFSDFTVPFFSPLVRGHVGRVEVETQGNGNI
jgi:hypothetical protein